MHLLEEKIGSEVNSTKKRNKIEWILHVCACLVENNNFEICSSVIMVWKVIKEFSRQFISKNLTLTP